jgi:hypothetical protein
MSTTQNTRNTKKARQEQLIMVLPNTIQRKKMNNDITEGKGWLTSDVIGSDLLLSQPTSIPDRNSVFRTTTTKKKRQHQAHTTPEG